MSRTKELRQYMTPAHRPTANEWWKEKVRQTLQRGAGRSLGDGMWEPIKEAA